MFTKSVFSVCLAVAVIASATAVAQGQSAPKAPARTTAAPAKGAAAPAKTAAASAKNAVAPVKKAPSAAAQPGAGASLAATPAGGGSKLIWGTDLSKVMKLAKDANKLILVDVYTDWCGWCHKLDRDTYSNPDVVKFVNNQFVCLKLDAEDGGPGQAFAQEYQIGGFPCIMMLDSAGKLKGVFYGYRNASQFPDAVTKALQKGPPPREG